MADSSVVSFLLQNLSQLLASEANLLYGVNDKVRSLHNQLQMMDAFLKGSDGKKSKKEMEKVVVNQIREVAEEAEDVIDTFVTNMTMHKQRSKLGRMIHCVDHAKLLRGLSVKMDSIKATINEIHENKIKFDLFQQEVGESSSTGEEEQIRRQRLHDRRNNVEVDDVVGFVHDSKVVIQRLMDEGSRSNVVTIIGMGGLGKTIIARKVYNSTEVKERFKHLAFVYVSNDCRVKELLFALFKCLISKPEYELMREENDKKMKEKKEDAIYMEIPQDYSMLGVHGLKQILKEYLKGKRYLLVLDDLWKIEDWDELKGAFPNDNKGSKILITSRLKEVASHTSRDPPYNLPFLSDEESWNLFSKRVFRGEEYDADLEPLGKQIVKSCRGLPLSIVVLAGLLANKPKSAKEWSKVKGNVNSYLTQDETQHVKDIILKLSYDNLPNRLKPCFLYFGIFPEDSEIPVRQLLQQWVAEGFIQQTGTRSPEDVAEDYLYELIDRSLVQIAKVKSMTGGVKACRIHDLLRDLCISQSKEDAFFEVCTDSNILDILKPRKLSVHCSMPQYVSSSNNDHSFVRSLFYFGPYDWFIDSKWKWLLKFFKLVRVLDLGNIEAYWIPSNIKVFIHLRYLRILFHEDAAAVVPDSVCTLQSLQTLDIRGPRRTTNFSISFPGGIWELKQLRHVYSWGRIVLRDCHHLKGRGDKVMWNLQTISYIVVNRRSAYLFEKVRFPKLQKLGLVVGHGGKRELDELLPSLQQSSHLNKLELFLDSNRIHNSRIILEIGCKPHELLHSLQQLTHLNTLKVECALDLLTGNIVFPPCLTKLELYGNTTIDDDGVNALGNLTKLRSLRLADSSIRQFNLNCFAGGFPQLQVFEMRKCNVVTWKIAKGAMPLLQSLLIESCGELKSLPNELWSLTNLRKVRVVNSSLALSPTLIDLKMKNGCELTLE